jgi:predicted metal-dependent hydrolase
MKVQGIDITIQRKKIRSVRISITREGEVRLSIPKYVKESEAISFAESKIVWIKKHLERINRVKALEPEDFSSVLFIGESIKTEFLFNSRKQQVILCDDGIFRIYLKPETKSVLSHTKSIDSESIGNRPTATASIDENLQPYIPKINLMIDRWRATELSKIITRLAEEWEPVMGVKAESFCYRKMKSRWGTCNVVNHRITLNTELTKKSYPCIEYILVHEMAHLIERGHGPRFKAVMDKYLPHWRELRLELNDKILS